MSAETIAGMLVSTIRDDLLKSAILHGANVLVLELDADGKDGWLHILHVAGGGDEIHPSSSEP